MKWHLETFEIKDLIDYDKNPRSLSEKEYMHLSESLEKFGLVDKPVVNTDKTIIGGHQRIKVLFAKGADEVECWVPDLLLDEKQVEELNIRLNRNNGSFDYDILSSSFEIGDLLTWGFEEDDLGLGKAEKPKPQPKPVISLEFSDKDVMLEYMEKCEEIAMSSSAKMKVRG